MCSRPCFVKGVFSERWNGYNLNFQNYEKGKQHGTRKGYGQSPTGEKRSVDDADLHQRQAVLPLDANEGPR